MIYEPRFCTNRGSRFGKKKRAEIFKKKFFSFSGTIIFFHPRLVKLFKNVKTISLKRHTPFNA